jgi:ABC-2 type transport system ATP-binding protein
VSRPAAAVSVEGLRVVRGGVPVLDGLSLEVDARSVTGLVGPSGGGKSTLMRAIVGVQVVAGGTVTVLGEPAGTTPSLRRRVGYMTQSLSVYADLSVQENLHYFARLYGASQDRVDELIETVDLGTYALLRRDLWNLFHRLADGGTTLVVSSHVMDEAERCDTLLLLRDSRLIATGTPDELRVRTGEDGLDAVFLRLVEETSDWCLTPRASSDASSPLVVV